MDIQEVRALRRPGGTVKLEGAMSLRSVHLLLMSTQEIGVKLLVALCAF